VTTLLLGILSAVGAQHLQCFIVEKQFKQTDGWKFFVQKL